MKAQKSSLFRCLCTGEGFFFCIKDKVLIEPAFNNGSQIVIKENCIGCGICAKVCPVDNFYIEEGRAKRKNQTCEFCLACAQNCPQKAIGLRIMDKNPNARYRNEQISLKEIIEANGKR